MITKDVSWEQLAWGDDAELMWETFHENSKATHYDDPPTTETVYQRMLNLKNSLEYDSFPAIALPGPAEFPPPQRSLYEAISERVTPAALRPVELPLATLTAILHHMYGINRSNVGTRFPRPFRNVPSGGGLFPLEIYFHTQGRITGLERGIYHYNPEQHVVRRVIAEDMEDGLAAALFQPEIVRGAAVVLFQTALFGRNVFKYRDRGYRFALIEAGHVAQNLNLVATALGLGVWNVGGYIDAEIDRLLGIDGVNHSTLYLHAIGGRVE
jgi:SagB-type dehydrogenase family enzyme